MMFACGLSLFMAWTSRRLLACSRLEDITFAHVTFWTNDVCLCLETLPTAAQESEKSKLSWPHCNKVKGHAISLQASGRDQRTAEKRDNTDFGPLYLFIVCFIVLHA